MVSNNLQMLLTMATVLIVYESSLSPTTSHAMASEVMAAAKSSLTATEMNVNGRSHINKLSITDSGSGFFNRMPRHIVQGQQQELPQNQEHHHHQQQQPADAVDPATSLNSIKRSYSSANGVLSLSSPMNALAGLSSLQHIRGGGIGYDAVPRGSAHINTHQLSMYTEAKPIYEEQQEHGYTAPSENSQHYGNIVESGGGGGGSANTAALHSAIYNLQTAGTHNAAVGTAASGTNNGGSDGFLPSWNFGKLSTSFTTSAAASTPYHNYHSGGVGGGGHGGADVDSSGSSSNNDKISEGNFLHHYDSASGYNELTHQQQDFQQQHYQSQYQPQYESHSQHQYGEHNYNSVEQPESSSSHSGEDIQHHYDHTNYSPSAPASGVGGGHHEEKQPDVINYVPYPVVKKLHVPVHEPVKIPVSQAVIIPISKPVPIHVPITQNVQVPVEKELKIPVERVIPYPVEKHVPVPVEKRVPYTVFKYVPIKVTRPFPVKVPVFKTVLHKVKSWW